MADERATKSPDSLKLVAFTPTTLTPLIMLAALEYQATSDDEFHRLCEPCHHDQTLAWYRAPHCWDTGEPWPCDTAIRYNARIYLSRYLYVKSSYIFEQAPDAS